MTDAVTMASPLAPERTVPAHEMATSTAMRYRSLAMWAYIAYLPAYVGMLHRSEFIGSWDAGGTGAAPAGSRSGGSRGAEDMPAIGNWLMRPELPDPTSPTRLAQVDCLSGMTVLQLDQLGPVALTVPANPTDRYYSVAVLDAHLNNFSYVGPQWSGNMSDTFLIAPPGWHDAPPVWVRGVIQAPSGTVFVHNRVRVAADRSDLDQVRRFREGFRLTTLDQWGKPHPEMPRLDASGYRHDGLRTLTDPFEFFQLVGEYVAHNPPTIPQIHLGALFRGIGIGMGATPPADPGLRAAMADGVRDAQRMLNGMISGGDRHNGWLVPDPNVGRATPYLLVAAAYQLTQPAGTSQHEAMCYLADRDRDGHHLDGRTDGGYELSFAADALPPAREPGFWSLTMYRTRDDLLVANPVNRYAVRPDTPGFQRAADGSVTIAIGRERPEHTPSGNWLPAPADPFTLGLRVYYPGAAALTHDWLPPGVRKIG